MNQVGQLRRIHVKSNVGKRFAGVGNDAVVRENRMRDHGYVPLGHVAARAIIGWIFSLSDCHRHRATLLGVTGKTLLAKVRGDSSRPGCTCGSWQLMHPSLSPLPGSTCSGASRGSAPAGRLWARSPADPNGTRKMLNVSSSAVPGRKSRYCFPACVTRASPI